MHDEASAYVFLQKVISFKAVNYKMELARLFYWPSSDAALSDYELDVLDCLTLTNHHIGNQ